MESTESAIPPQPRTTTAIPTGRTTTKSTGPANRKTVNGQQEGGTEDNPDVGARKRDRCKHYCRLIVDSNYSQVLFMLLTLYALFGDNIRLMATQKKDDDIFAALTITSMFVFTTEIVLSCIGKSDYPLSFFFWLDVLSTASLVMDIPAVSEALFGGGEGEGDNALRAGRAGRAGTKAGRVVRIVRLIRIVKLYKAMQEAQAKKRRKLMMERARKAGHAHDDDWLYDDDGDGDNAGRESRVGKKLSDMTTRRVIILVLAMLFVLPNLEATSLDPLPFSGYYGADRVQDTFMDAAGTGKDTPGWAREQEAYEDTLLMYIHYHNWYSYYEVPECGGDCTGPFDYRGQVFWVGFAGTNRMAMVEKAQFQVTTYEEWWKKNMKSTDIFRMDPGIPDYAFNALKSKWSVSCSNYGGIQGVSMIGEHEEFPAECPDDLRYNERQVMSPTLLPDDQYKRLRFLAIVDKRPFTRHEAMLDTLKILFICLVLAVGSMTFSKDANVLVLYPLEQMIAKVEKIRDNPLIAMKLGDAEFKQEEIKKQKTKSMGEGMNNMNPIRKYLAKCWQAVQVKAESKEPMETVILEKTIIKIGTLLALGFGEAGANIIGHNMKGADTAGVNAMIAGSRVDCIIGCVSILNFTTITEVLQGGVMTFVNQVAEIVHGITDEYHGASNRNNGDSFLLIWRTSEGETDEARLAEMSIVAFVRMVAATARSPVLAEYRTHPGLLQRLRNFQVQMSYALHHGWSIEGAIGSEFKVDASYVSPNVNIALQLCEATRLYGLKLMISQAVVELVGPEMAKVFRLIDYVVVPGSREPMKMYTVDVDPTVLKLEKPLNTENLVWNMRRRFKARQALEAQKQLKLSENLSMIDELNNSPDFKAMRARFNERFTQVFGMAFQNYVAGEWKIAYEMLKETRTTLLGGQQDGPSVALLDFMTSYEVECPAGWQGYRLLPLPGVLLK